MRAVGVIDLITIITIKKEMFYFHWGDLIKKLRIIELPPAEPMNKLTEWSWEMDTNQMV